MATSLPRHIGPVPGSKMVTARCHLTSGCENTPTAMLTSPGFDDPGCDVHLVPYIKRGLGIRTIRAFTRVEEAVIAEAWKPEPEPVVIPDIELPVAYPQPEDNVPLTAVIEFAGHKLQLVNWFDYMGWEVRRMATDWTPTNHDPSLLSLGYLSPTGSRVKKNGSSMERTFKTNREALSFLLGHTS